MIRDEEIKGTDTIDSEVKVDELIESEINENDDISIEWYSTDEETVAKKPKKKTAIIYNAIRYVIMLFALVVFGYAAYELTIIYVESKEGAEVQDSASQMFMVDLDSLQEDYEPPTNANGEALTLENQGDGQLFVYDHEKMLEYNSDAKGYIRQDNGEYIDNPILQHPTDNEYYLKHLADHTKNSVGSIYIDVNIKDGLNAKNCIIYGHNMGQRVGRIMFGSLNWYYHETGWAKDHPTFDIWIEDTHYRYYVFAIYKTEAIGSWVYQYGFSSDEEFMEYIDKCLKASKYKFKEAPEITAESMILTLSTCTSSDDQRMIVQLVRGEELDIYGNPVGAEGEAEEATKDAN